MPKMRVHEYMSSPVIVVSPSDTITRACNLMPYHGIGRLMDKHGFRSVPVVDGKGDIGGIVVKHHILWMLASL